MATYSISGTVTKDGGGLQYVYVQAVYGGEVAGVASTAVDGTYTIADLTDAQTYTVIPTRAGYGFTPETYTVAVSGSNETGVDFVAEGIGYGTHAVPGSAEIELALHQPPVLTVNYRGAASALDEVVLGLGAYVEVDGSGVFGGSVDEITELMPAGRSDARYWRVTFRGWEQRLRHRLVFIDAGSPNYTVTQIIDNINTQVLAGASATFREDIAVGTIDGGSTELYYPSYLYWPASDVLDQLAEIVGGYWHIDAWPRTLHLRQFGEVAAPWALSTSADVWEIEVRRHREAYANYLRATTRTSWSQEGVSAYAVDTGEIAARILVEGGSGRYESMISAPESLVRDNDEDTEAALQAEVDALLPQHAQMGWEITYTTHETDLRPGMEQTVNLNSEFGIDGEVLTVTRVVMQELESGKWRSRVTLEGGAAPRTWEREVRETLVVGQKPRALPGTWGLPRYLRE